MTNLISLNVKVTYLVNKGKPVDMDYNFVSSLGEVSPSSGTWGAGWSKKRRSRKSSSKHVLSRSNTTKLKKTPHCLLANHTFHFVTLLFACVC